MDDLKAAHANSEVNDDFLSWHKTKYANDGVGKVTVTRGKRHEYLGMTLVFMSEGKHLLCKIEKVENNDDSRTKDEVMTLKYSNREMRLLPYTMI